MNTARELYLDLMMLSLTDWLYDEFAEPVRAEGLDWPARAHTMIGLKRLANLRCCIENVLCDSIVGDLIESTIQALECLYYRLSVGGYMIVDDYGNVAGCRQAVHDFRDVRAINDPIRPIDWAGVFWRRSSDARTVSQN